jgi:hypothetical protein
LPRESHRAFAPDCPFVKGVAANVSLAGASAALQTAAPNLSEYLAALKRPDAAVSAKPQPPASTPTPTPTTDARATSGGASHLKNF